MPPKEKILNPKSMYPSQSSWTVRQCNRFKGLGLNWPFLPLIIDPFIGPTIKSSKNPCCNYGMYYTYVVFTYICNKAFLTNINKTD